MCYGSSGRTASLIGDRSCLFRWKTLSLETAIQFGAARAVAGALVRLPVNHAAVHTDSLARITMSLGRALLWAGHYFRHERGSGCWHRETACYGLRRLVLCTACAAALTGETCQRVLSPGATRLTRPGGVQAVGGREARPRIRPISRVDLHSGEA